MQETSKETFTHVPIEVNWIDGLNFEAGQQSGPKVRIDADAHSAPSPFDMLLAAIASCAAVDVVTILAKQRTPVQALSVRVDASRIDAIPRRLAAAVLHFTIAALGTNSDKATRAVELSVCKYCSVRASLAGDVPVTWTVELSE